MDPFNFFLNDTALKNFFESWKRTASYGNAGAMNNVGVFYALGFCVEEDYEEAIYWWKRAAKLGHADAIYNLGLYACYQVEIPDARKDAVYMKYRIDGFVTVGKYWREDKHNTEKR